MVRRLLPFAYAVGATALIIVGVAYWWCWWTPHKTAILVRHAERASSAPDSPLSAAGVQRAQALVHVAGDTNVTDIYVTQFVRTQQTAEPLAGALGITPTEYAAGDIEGIAGLIRGRLGGSVVLVVGHSDTVPMILNELGVGTVPPIAHNEFDNLYVVDICRCRASHATRLKYGDLS